MQSIRGSLLCALLKSSFKSFRVQSFNIALFSIVATLAPNLESFDSAILV